MALLGELGNKFPVQQEGHEVPLDDDDVMMVSGDVMEIHFVSDKDMNYIMVAECIHGILRYKEDYPLFVLHYIGFEKRKIIMQFSIAPVGATGSGLWAFAVKGIIIRLIALIVALLAAYLIAIAADRGYIFSVKPPAGNASVVARNHETDDPLPNVQVSVAGRTQKTGPHGEVAFFKDLPAGEHMFVGAEVEGYQTPTPIKRTVVANDHVLVTIYYAPEGYTPPTTGWLIIDTIPVKGAVFVDGVPHGNAPKTVEVDVGEHVVYFGWVKGYEIPGKQTVTVAGGKTEVVLGRYIKPGDDWLQKYARYALIGGGVILGAALIVPEVIRGITRRSDQ